MDSKFIEWLAKDGCEKVGGAQYCVMLHALANSCRAKSVLEFGLGWGYSGVAFCSSMAQRGGGRLVSVDANVSALTPDLANYATQCGVKWNVISKHSGEFTSMDSYDLIYTDIDPSAADNESVFRSFYDNLRPGGLFIYDGFGGYPTISVLVASLTKKGYIFTPLMYNENYGHAVHRRPDGKEDVYRAMTMRCRRCDWKESGPYLDIFIPAVEHSRVAKHFVESVSSGGQ